MKKVRELKVRQVGSRTNKKNRYGSIVYVYHKFDNE